MNRPVTVVVDPEFGDRLGDISEYMPVWIADTPSNKIVCQRLWKVHSQCDNQTDDALTSFTIEDPEARLDNLLCILPTLEDHYGYSYTLKVVGLNLNDQLKNDLEKKGFSLFRTFAEGFETRR